MSEPVNLEPVPLEDLAKFEISFKIEARKILLLQAYISYSEDKIVSTTQRSSERIVLGWN